MESRKRRILFVVSEDWYFWSHRLDLARAARNAGWEVLVATRVQDHGKRIESEGFKLIPLQLRRRSWNPLREFATFVELIRLYRRERPNLVHHVAVKLVLYGSLAARFARKVAVVNAFTGLGYLFAASGWRAKLLRCIVMPTLRWALTLPHSQVILQNHEDYEQLVRMGVLQPCQAVIVRGSGVDITKFTLHPEADGTPLVVLPSRMLWDKGVGEFVQAARLLKEWGVRAQCVLVGRVDTENPTSVPEVQLLAWQQEGAVAWWGFREDMPSVFVSAHVVVLPTYYEGLPKVLLEAAACGKPIVATNIAGCREIVRHGDNGILVPVRDVQALACSIARLVGDSSLRQRMGMRGRDIVVQEFSSGQIAQEIFAVYRKLLNDGCPTSDVSD